MIRHRGRLELGDRVLIEASRSSRPDTWFATSVANAGFCVRSSRGRRASETKAWSCSVPDRHQPNRPERPEHCHELLEVLYIFGEAAQERPGRRDRRREPEREVLSAYLSEEPDDRLQLGKPGCGPQHLVSQFELVERIGVELPARLAPADMLRYR